MPRLPRPLPLALLALPLAGLARGDTPAPAFGFGPMEVYKIAQASWNLSIGDANGDKIPDLFISNNEKVKVEVLVQRKPGEPAVKEASEGPNHPGSDARFKREGIPLPRKAAGLVTGDWNGDGLTDVAYYTDPPELRIQLRTASGWSEPAIHPIREGHLHPGSLSTADVTGDGKPDILVLGKGKLFLVPWKSPGVFGAPTVMPLTEDDFWYVYPRDVSGDGRLDLVFMKSESETPVRIRIGTPTGFRPEVAPDLGTCRAVDVADIGQGKGDEILFLEQRTGRLRVLSYAEAPAKGLGSPQFLPLPLSKTAKERSVAIGDVDGDGRNDILVAEQKGSQLSVFRQDSSGTFSRWEEFPTLSGVTALQIGDVTGDGAADVVVLSPVERAVGVHEWRDGRLQFPRVLPGLAVEGKPAACGLVDADGAAPLDLAVAVEVEPKEGEKGAKKKRQIHLFVAGKGEGKLAATLDLTATENPDGIAATDLDRDGAADLVAFYAYDAAKLVRIAKADAGLSLAEVKVPEGMSRGLWTNLQPSGFATADTDGDGRAEGLVAPTAKGEKGVGYARAVVLDPKSGEVSILDQFNAVGKDDVLVGSAALDVDGDGRPEIVLADKTAETLTVLGKDKVYRPVGAVPLPGFGLQGLLVADLNGDKRPDLLAIGERRLAIVALGGVEARLKDLGLYEPDDERTVLSDVAVGDLNNDGRPDVAVTESRKKHLQVLTIEEAPAGSERPLQLRRALSFPVFEEKAADARRQVQMAREMLVADMTQDGKQDLLLLIHDRVLLYPQE